MFIRYNNILIYGELSITAGENISPKANLHACANNSVSISFVGWGKCQQQFRNIDVLQNVGTTDKPNWQAVTLESSNFCECSVKSGSALHNFIAS